MNEATKKIDHYLGGLPQWQENNLALFRDIVHKADPSIEEAWKWDVPVFLLNGKTIFAMSAFKAHTKYNFILNGALLDDVDQLFNNGLESKKSRGIDLKEAEAVNEAHLYDLVRKSIALAKR